MSAPSHDDDQLKLEIFDSFSKTVMRNASRNFAAAAKTRRKNESVNTDIVQYILKTHGENAVYPSEHFIDAGNGYCCVVATEWLYQAMLLLPPKQKEVVILEFWYGMSISEISETLRISRRSVSERKKNAFANIRSAILKKPENVKPVEIAMQLDDEAIAEVIAERVVNLLRKKEVPSEPKEPANSSTGWSAFFE